MPTEHLNINRLALYLINGCYSPSANLMERRGNNATGGSVTSPKLQTRGSVGCDYTIIYLSRCPLTYEKQHCLALCGSEASQPSVNFVEGHVTTLLEGGSCGKAIVFKAFSLRRYVWCSGNPASAIKTGSSRSPSASARSGCATRNPHARGWRTSPGPSRHIIRQRRLRCSAHLLFRDRLCFEPLGQSDQSIPHVRRGGVHGHLPTLVGAGQQFLAGQFGQTWAIGLEGTCRDNG